MTRRRWTLTLNPTNASSTTMRGLSEDQMRAAIMALVWGDRDRLGEIVSAADAAGELDFAA
jgi:hypothetical protein